MDRKIKEIVSLVLTLAMLICTVNVSALEILYGEKVNLPTLKLPVEEKILVNHGILVLEAEDMEYQNFSSLYADDKASGGYAVAMNTTKWSIEETTVDDLYTDIFVPTPEDAGNYRLWIRSRTTHPDSGSVWVNPNTGVWAAHFFASERDGEYRWSSLNLTLAEGKNKVSFRTRTAAIYDKIIITNDFGFTPENKNDVPVYMTEKEKDTLWRTYWKQPEYTPIEGHPRLLLTKDFIPTLKNNLEGPGLVEMKDRFIGKNGYAYEELNCKLDTSKANNHSPFICTKIMSRALNWVLGNETDPAYVRKTLEYMKDYLETVRTPDDEGDITRSRGNVLYTAAIVYDWMYDCLTESDKEYFKDKMITICLSKEIGWPPVNMSDIATHAGEQEIFRDLLGAGIALYDEYPLIYDLAAGRMFEKMIPARKWLRNTGRFDQGNDYFLCRTYSELWGDMTMQRMGYPPIFDGAEHKAFLYRIDGRMPYGSMIPDGDMYSLTRTSYKQYYCDYVLAPYIAANLYKDPYLKLECMRTQLTGNFGEYENFFVLLFTDPEVDTKIWDDWNMAKYTSYPLSGIIARTSWQEGFNSNAAMAMMDMHEVYVGDHQHKYTGVFQIYYKGLLAMDTGTYNYSNAHNEGYSHRAISANSVLVYDPAETFKPSWGSFAVQNDGGQKLPYDKNSTVLKYDELQLDENGIMQNKELEVAKNVKHYVGPNAQTPEFSFISGDISPAYTDKVSKYNRSMVFMDLDNDKYPAAFVVYDVLDTKQADFKKVWLLHSQEKPQVSGNTTVIERVQNGFGGKLVNKTMYPNRSNCKIEVVGGVSNEMFTINGYQYGAKSDAIEGGNYRIEVSPRMNVKSDRFLNAMYVTDAGNTEELPMIQEEQAGFVGATIMNKTVLFAKGYEKQSGTFSISVRNNGYDEMSVLISGVSAGVYNISSDNGYSRNVEVTSDSETLVFKATPGRYTIAPAAENAIADTVISPKMDKKAIGDFMIWVKDPENSSMSAGNYIYLEKPTKMIDGVTYIACEVLSEFGVSANVSGNIATFEGKSGVIKVTADSYTADIGNNKITLKYAPKLINDTVYINPAEFEKYLGYSFSYKGDLSRVLYVEKTLE